MKAMRLWHGIRMREVAASADPDQPARMVTLPVSWDQGAAEALAALVPGEGPVSLAAASSVWLTLVAARARQAGRSEAAGELLELLQRRQAAPNAAIWTGQAGCPGGGVPGFQINAAGFYTAGNGYDVAGFARAGELAAQACHVLSPASDRYEIGLTGLDDLLACTGLAYDSPAARAVGACLAALLRASVEHALEGNQRDLLATSADWPAPPARCALPGLAEAAAAAHARLARTPDAVPSTGVFPPGPSDALLGVETGGISPAFSPVRDLRLTRAAQDRLAAASLSPEAALAAALVGETPLPLAGVSAHGAMHQAIAPYLDVMPDLPAALPRYERSNSSGSAPAKRRDLPARHSGLTQKVSVGGHRVFLRTAEYEDGRLGEFSLSLPRETAMVRGLAEGFAQAVSLGLQHGVGLDEYVEAFALTRFGPSGPVEGDPEVDRATSVLDYVFRTLSAAYLDRALPPPPAEDEPHALSAPLLPLDLPPARSRRGALRLVA